jgi:hypothetical protein
MIRGGGSGAKVAFFSIFHRLSPANHHSTIPADAFLIFP